MRAVILCEFPDERHDVRSWILGRATTLAIKGQAELKFIGTEHTASGNQVVGMVAIGIASVERGREILSAWHLDGQFPGSVETRLLQTETAHLDIPMFP